MPVSKTEVWIDWALQKAERLPVVGDRVANYRQERVWNNPAAVADHNEWMAKVIASNDRDDLINGDPGSSPVVPNANEQASLRHETSADLDREWMTPEDWREAYSDTQHDYAEAYADVAGDATLFWRLEEEDPRDILDDVRREAARRVGPLEPDADHGVAGTISHPDQQELFITALTASLAEHGYAAKEFGLEQDTAPERGIGR